MHLRRNAVLVVVGVIVGSLLSVAPAGATIIKPTVTGFSSSSTSLYKTGGTVTLSATVAHAATCVFTSNKAIAGLPYTTTPCGGLVIRVLTLPVNSGKRSVVYSFKLSATGSMATHAKPIIKVAVTTQLPPPLQVAPTGRSVSTADSASFTDQLNAIGGYGADTFAITSPNSGLIVTPSGAVSTAGHLMAGAYVVGGTVSDAVQDVGNWTYVLTVTEAPLSGVTAITAGNNHACALLSGNVACWGDNEQGQLGIGTLASSSVPVTVPGLTGVTAISAGENHTCALMSDGAVRCWGWNPFGQLGNGTTTDSSVPVAVSGLSQVTAISADSTDTCAVLSGGTVDCWGYNHNGELGNGTTSDSSVPVAVTGLAEVTSITSAGAHTCALLSDGTVRCWGGNYNGELGNGTTTSSNVPVTATGLSGGTMVTTRWIHTCALNVGGKVECWGDNSYGELGIGVAAGSNVPVAATGLSEVTSVAAGALYTCALQIGGTVECWGYNFFGELGNGSTVDSIVAVAVISH